MSNQRKLPEEILLTKKEIEQIKKTSISNIQQSAGEKYYPWLVGEEKVYLPKSSLDTKDIFAKDPNIEMNTRPIYK